MAGEVNAYLKDMAGTAQGTTSNPVYTSTSGTGNQSTVSVAIALNTATSAEVDLGGKRLMAMMMPATWTAANITFQASNATGGTFYDLYDDSGNEVTVTAAGARIISIDATVFDLAPLRFIKVRSGTTSTPVNQTAAKTITLILKE